MVTELTIYDPHLAKYVDTLSVVLLYNDKYGFLPELYEIFGRENLIRFLDTFSGTTFQVPSRESLDRAIRDVIIWVEMSKDCRQEVAEALAFRYEVAIMTVWNTYNTMKELMKGYKISIRELEDRVEDEEDDEFELADQTIGSLEDSVGDPDLEWYEQAFEEERELLDSGPDPDKWEAAFQYFPMSVEEGQLVFLTLGGQSIPTVFVFPKPCFPLFS